MRQRKYYPFYDKYSHKTWGIDMVGFEQDYVS